MKKIKNFKRFLTALVCCCLLVTGFSFGAGATGNNQPPTKGKLTLYKYDNSSTANDNKGNPVKGATFTAYKVANITSNGIESLITGTTFSADTELDSALIQTVRTYNGLTSYTVTSPETGVYTFNDMDLGIYMVVETQSPAGYYATTDAFLVSIPQTEADGKTFDYDVEAYPKNKFISVEKSVTAIGTKGDSYSIGDIVPFTVQSTIPQYSAEAYENEEALEYYFIDTMSDGLTFDRNSVKVYIGNSTNHLDNTGNKYFTIESPYNYEVNGENITATVKIALTSEALIEFKGQPITVKYNAILNEKAKITTGDMNSVTLTFTTNPQTEEKHTTDPETTKVYTYQMDLTKTFDGTPTVDLSKVLFTLKNSDGDSIFAENIKDVWTIDTRVSSVGDGFTDKLTLTQVGNQYKLIIKGLAAGDYTLTEVSTIPGYNLLKAPIEIEVIETKTDGVVTGVVKAKVDGKDIISETGSFGFTVNNTKGFDLPQTGGMGTWMYTLGGLFIMAASAVVMLSMRKRRAVK